MFLQPEDVVDCKCFYVEIKLFMLNLNKFLLLSSESSSVWVGIV